MVIAKLLLVGKKKSHGLKLTYLPDYQTLLLNSRASRLVASVGRHIVIYNEKPIVEFQEEL